MTEWEQRLEELFTSWACRVGAHTSCGGLGFQLQPGSHDMPCDCLCHDSSTKTVEVTCQYCGRSMGAEDIADDEQIGQSFHFACRMRQPDYSPVKQK